MERPLRSHPQPEQTGLETARETSVESRVTAAKQRLRAASGQVDYFRPIRERPLTFAGAAFVAGLLWKRLSRHDLTPGMLTLAAQLLRKL